MRITTVNIQAAGLPRARRLAGWLEYRDDDVVILTETSSGAGTAHLLAACRTAGWSVLAPIGDGERGCAMLSRLPLQPATALLDGVSLPGRVVAAHLDTKPTVTMVGLYAPSNDRAPGKAERKQRFLESLADALTRTAADLRAGLIVGGDYNLITRDHQPPYPGVFAASDFGFLDVLARLGLVDAHRHLHPGDQPHSWIGHRGHPYRYDYLHLAGPLTPLLSASTYLHDVREAGLSDHAAVSIDTAIATGHLPRADGPVGQAPVLF